MYIYIFVIFNFLQFHISLFANFIFVLMFRLCICSDLWVVQVCESQVVQSRGWKQGNILPARDYNNICHDHTIKHGLTRFISFSHSKMFTCIPDNCHYRHYRRQSTFFKPAYLFPQRTLNGLLLGKFTQRIKHKSAHFLKILDAPSQNLNVTNQHPNATDTNYAIQNTRYAKQNTKYAKQNTQYAK